MIKIPISKFSCTFITKMAYHAGDFEDMEKGEYSISIHPSILKWCEDNNMNIRLSSNNPLVEERNNKLVGSSSELNAVEQVLVFDSVDDALIFKLSLQ